MYKYCKFRMHNILSIFLLICVPTPARSTTGGCVIKGVYQLEWTVCQPAIAHPKIHRSERSSRALLIHPAGSDVDTAWHTCFTDLLQNQQMTGCQSERYSPMKGRLEASSTEVLIFQTNEVLRYS